MLERLKEQAARLLARQKEMQEAARAEQERANRAYDALTALRTARRNLCSPPVARLS